MKKVISSVLISAAILFVGLTGPATANIKSVVLGVEMYCASCEYMVRHSLNAVPGVVNVDVSLERKSALVVYDDTETQLSDLVAAPAALGYETIVLTGTDANFRDPRRPKESSSSWSGEDDDLWSYLMDKWSTPDSEAP